MKKLGLLMMCALVLNCGVYSFRSTNLPSELKTIYIPIFESELRGEEVILDVKEDLTDAVQNEFLRITRLTLADESNADAIFLGTVKRYAKEVSNYDENENPIEYKIALTIQAEFRNRITDDVIWQQTNFMTYEYFAVQSSREDLGEQDALMGLIQKAARDLVSKATENW